MRTYNVLVSCGLIGLAFGWSPAVSFDGTRTPEGAIVTVPLPAAPEHNTSRAAPFAVAPAAPALGAAPLAVVPVVPGPAAPVSIGRPAPEPFAGRALPMPVPEPFMARPAITAPPSPFEALRSGVQASRDGRPDEAVSSLEYAAARGVPGAIWKLGRMYADGDGVSKNKLRAYEYFRILTKTHAYDPPNGPHAGFVANAFVSLGHIYLEGIPDTAIKPDAMTAHEMFRYAASYFRDPEAQYQLGRMFLYGDSGFKDAIQAARWFKAAAEKNHRSAQALLGTMLFNGQDIPRQAAVGLFWLAVAQDASSADDSWITETYSEAFAKASVDEQTEAYRLLVDWLRRQRTTRR